MSFSISRITILLILIYYLSNATSDKSEIKRFEMENETLKNIFADRQIIFLVGPPRIGKTYLALQYFKNTTNLQYADLKDEEIMAEYNRDKDEFLNKYRILDGPEPHSSILNDTVIRTENNTTACQYILIGSVNFLWTTENFNLSQIVKFKTGSYRVVRLFPLSLKDMYAKPENLSEIIVKGGYPGANLATNLTEFFDSYIDNTLYKLYEKHLKASRYFLVKENFRSLLKRMAKFAGTFFDEISFANMNHVKSKIVSLLTQFLKDKYIIETVKSYRSSSDKVKLFFTDTGFICHLLGIKNVTEYETDFKRGYIYKNLVYMEMRKAIHRNSYSRSPSFPMPHIYFYTIHLANKTYDVDFLFRNDNGIYVFQTKSNRKKVSLRTFHEFKEKEGENINVTNYYVYSDTQKINETKITNNSTIEVNFVYVTNLSDEIDKVFK